MHRCESLGAMTPVFERREAVQENWGGNYYNNINSSGSRIVNFHNADDAALKAWEFNQITKPDTLGGLNWLYGFETVCDPSELICDPFPDIEDNERVRDIF